MKNFENQFIFFESQIENFNRTNQTISEGSVGWHIAHCTLVMVTVANAVSSSEASNFKSKFNLKKTIIFLLNTIPRGKGKAPTRVIPTEVTIKENLIENIAKAKLKLQTLKMLDKHSYFEHPYFGNLNLKDTLKFLQIHNNHHAKIIKDITK